MNNNILAILNTSRVCGHCMVFRGNDGNPTDDKEWCPELIRNIITGVKNPMNYDKVKVPCIIEIHTSTMEPYADNIIQVNEYMLVKSFYEQSIGQKNGTSILHISYSRVKDGKMVCRAKIDGIYDENYTKKIIEDQLEICLPEQVNNLRLADKAGNNEEIKIILNEYPENKEVSDAFSAYSFSPEAFKTFIHDNYSSFITFLKNNVPEKLKEIVPHYPCWSYISVDNWKHSLKTNESVYMHVNGCKVTKNENDEYIARTSEYEDHLVTLEKLISGEYKITDKE